MTTDPRRRWTNRLTSALVVTGTLLFALPLLALLIDVAHHGIPGPGFLLEAPRDAGRAGGVLPILVSTLLLLGVTVAAAGPLGLACAVLLAEIGPREGALAVLVRRSLDVLAAVPSVVFGLFGSVLFCRVLGLGYSLLSGGLTLACMVLPLFVRTSEASLRAIPEAIRQAAAALGLGRATTVVRLLLPAAAPGLAAGLVLAVGRALAETAALLFTSGYVDRMPSSLFDSGRSLSIHVYDLAMNVPGGDAGAHRTALVLMLLLVAVNAATGALGARLGRHGASP